MTQNNRMKRRQRGFTITEVAFAIIILGMMATLFGAVFPMTIRGAQHSSNYAQAAMIAQHKMDQIRSAGFGNLSQSQLQSLQVIDPAQPSGFPQAVTGGATYSFTAADSLVNDGTTQGYFPPGSQGLVTVADYASVHSGSGVPAGLLTQITVQVSWTGGAYAGGSYSTTTLLAKN